VVGCGASNPASIVTPATAAAPLPAKPVPDEGFVASGPIIVENQVDVLAQREGVVAQTLVDTSAPVRKGQVLARLDDRQLQAEREAAMARMRSIEYDQKNWEAKVRMDEVDLERARKMWDAQLIPKEQLEHDQFKLVASRNELEREKQDYLNAEALLRALDLEIEKTRIAAPFEGLVARRYVRAGQKVAKDERMFWVTAESPLLVKFALPERFFGRVNRGETLTVTRADFDEQHIAKVIEVSPVVDPSSGTIEVVAQLLGARGEFRPGMTANIRVPDSR
jgi:RND family efflux transporter MFP subunit